MKVVLGFKERERPRIGAGAGKVWTALCTHRRWRNTKHVGVWRDGYLEGLDFFSPSFFIFYFWFFMMYSVIFNLT